MLPLYFQKKNILLTGNGIKFISNSKLTVLEESSLMPVTGNKNISNDSKRLVVQLNEYLNTELHGIGAFSGGLLKAGGLMYNQHK